MNAEQLCLFEISRSEIDRIIAAIGEPKDDDIAALVDDLETLEPYAGLVIECPESAVDHVRVMSGSHRDLPISVAIISNGQDAHGRILAVERNVELVTQAIAGIKAKGIVLEAGGRLLSVGRQLETMAGAASLDINSARELLEKAAENIMEAFERLDKLAA